MDANESLDAIHAALAKNDAASARRHARELQDFGAAHGALPKAWAGKDRASCLHCLVDAQWQPSRCTHEEAA